MHHHARPKILFRTLSCLCACSILSMTAQAEPSAVQSLKKTVSSASKSKAKTQPSAAKKSAAQATKTQTPKADLNAEAVLFNVRFNGVTESFAIRLRPDVAPRTAANFRQNAQSGVYNGLAIHRAVRGYLVQMGDPTTADDAARGTWGTADNGVALPTEGKGLHKRGSVAMARRPDQKESSGSQFYILLKDAPSLDGQYSVFGEVVSGIDTLTRIAGTATDENDIPLSRVEIASAQLTTVGALPQQTKKTAKSTKSDAEKGFFDRVMERIW